MNYWRGVMNWPIVQGWQCETCGCEFSIIFGGLTWGLVNGICRCDTCHTQYRMRIDKEILTTPQCLLKQEYKMPLKQAWIKYHTPIDELTDAQIDEFMGAKEVIAANKKD